jgi:hypothetical protein
VSDFAPEASTESAQTSDDPAPLRAASEEDHEAVARCQSAVPARHACGPTTRRPATTAPASAKRAREHGNATDNEPNQPAKSAAPHDSRRSEHWSKRETATNAKAAAQPTGSKHTTSHHSTKAEHPTTRTTSSPCAHNATSNSCDDQSQNQEPDSVDNNSQEYDRPFLDARVHTLHPGFRELNSENGLTMRKRAASLRARAKGA